jgi:Mg2+ and Co2+ transporter CorA
MSFRLVTGHPGRRPLRERLRGPVHEILTDHLMMVLALLLVPTNLLPLFFPFTYAMLVIFEAVNYVIILVFVFEYFAKLYVAEDRRKHFRDPWHLLDLLIVVLAMLDLLPFIPLRGGIASPLLRLLRVTRAFAIVGRTVQRAECPGASSQPTELMPPQQLKIRIMGEATGIHEGTRECAVERIQAPTEIFVDLQDFSHGDLDFISETLQIPKHVLESRAIQESFPRIDYFKNYTTIYLSDPRLIPAPCDNPGFTISTNNFLIICANDNLINISTGQSDLLDRVVSEGLVLPEESFIVRVLYSILKRKLRDYEEIVRALERKTVQLEEVPVGDTDKNFLEETFHLRKEIHKVLASLWHFRQVLGMIEARKVQLVNVKEESLEQFAILHGESEYAYETLEHAKDSVQSLIELHINTISYDMNRVMRLLAVITSLALIPTIIGGLLGENLSDQPYQISIFEVSFLVIALMLLALYAYWRKGWLK